MGRDVEAQSRVSEKGVHGGKEVVARHAGANAVKEGNHVRGRGSSGRLPT